MNYRWFLVGALLVGVALFVIFLLPFFLNAESFRPTIESQLSHALGREVTVGKLSFSLLHGSLVADDIAISDDPAFSKVPFLQARQLEVGVEIIPLLSHKQVRITALTLNGPSIQLIEHASGKWNYSSLGVAPSQDASGQQPASTADVSIDELKVVNGSALVSSSPVTARPFEYTEINLSVKDFSFAKSSPFELSAKLPGGGTLKLTGNAGPFSQADTTDTPFHATLQVREFDIVAAGVVDANKGVTMTTDIDAEIQSDGITAYSTGKIKAARLQLVPKGSPAKEPVDIDFSASQNLDTREGTISDIAIHIGPAAIHVNGPFKFTPDAVMLNLHLSASAVPIEHIDAMLPVVGIRLPSGSSLQGGTLSASMAVTGQATSANVAGSVEIDNTRLAGFDLGSKIDGLPQSGGARTQTEIRVLKAKLGTSPLGTRLTDISGDLPQIGTATGEGTVAPAGELDFRLTAKLSDSSGTGIANRTIPLTITGTADIPIIRAGTSASRQ